MSTDLPDRLDKLSTLLLGIPTLVSTDDCLAVIAAARRIREQAAVILQRNNEIHALWERAERAEAERDALRALLRELVDGDHIYGNDSERVLIKIEAALGESK